MAVGSGTLDSDLKNLVLEEVPEELPRDCTKLNAGSYGFVYDVKIGGVLRVAKKLHQVFFEFTTTKEKEVAVENFKQECVILSKLRHPNVVQFVGVYYGNGGKDDIALVMEKLDCDLAGFLSDISTIELSTKLSILRDVSYGLVYLHEYNPPIIHRDLTARNILLNKRLQAKIADVGMAKLMDEATITAAKYTKAPGQMFYMPPEAKFSTPIYSYKLDIFSFGHLCLHTVLEDYPEVCELNFDETVQNKGITERRKRQKAFDDIGSDHILCSIIIQCLLDDPEKRPSSREVNEAIIDLTEKEVEVPISKLELAHPESKAQDDISIFVTDQFFTAEIQEEQATNFSQESATSSVDSSDAISAIQKSLLCAVKRGNIEKVKKYHKEGAKLTLPDSAGLTPLHYAARLNKIAVVEYIAKNIPKKALDIADDERLQTPLHKAAWYGFIEVCEILVEHGASLNILDYQCKSVLDRAEQSEVKELQDYIEGKLQSTDSHSKQ